MTDKLTDNDPSNDQKSSYTAEHQHRVAKLSIAIAKNMGMKNPALEELYMGALIHDLGKIQLSPDVLLNSPQLKKIEYKLIKEHPITGYDILAGTEIPLSILDIVRHHHERLDGSGYPDGISGDKISLEARIVGVADVVEAMSSWRPYRDSLGMDAALAEIKKGSNTIYDKEVVNVCIDLISNKGFEFNT